MTRYKEALSAWLSAKDTYDDGKCKTPMRSNEFNNLMHFHYDTIRQALSAMIEGGWRPDISGMTCWQVGIRRDGENTEAQPGKYIVEIMFDDHKIIAKWAGYFMENDPAWKPIPAAPEGERDEDLKPDDWC